MPHDALSFLIPTSDFIGKQFNWDWFRYKTDERSIRVAFILASATLAGAFGGAIAFGVGHMNGVHGLSGWRWLLILEGIPSCLSSIAVYFFLPDYPETASWLSAEEKELAAARLAIEGSHSHSENLTWSQAKETLTEWRLYAHYAVSRSWQLGFYPWHNTGLFWNICPLLQPVSVHSKHHCRPRIQRSYFSIDDCPSLCCCIRSHYRCVILGRPFQCVSPHYHQPCSQPNHSSRSLHSAIFASIGAIGFLASALLPATSFHARYGCLIVAASGAFSCIPPLLGFLSSNLFTTASVGLAIAMNISFGAPGQIAGVWIYKSNEALKGYPTGHWTNAALLFFVTAGCLTLRLYYAWRNKKIVQNSGGNMEGVRLFKYWILTANRKAIRRSWPVTHSGAGGYLWEKTQYHIKLKYHFAELFLVHFSTLQQVVGFTPCALLTSEYSISPH